MSGKLSKFSEELKRRKVYKVATVYAITGWLIIQVVDSVFPHLHIPDWMITTVIVIVLLGFPLALILAWAFEMSPEGIIRTSSPEAKDNPLPNHKRKPFTGRTSMIVLIFLLIGQFVYFRFIYHQGSKETNIANEASILPQKSIAVLPFKNMSEDQSGEYFSDGIMDAILNDLSRIKDLKVVSRTSVEQYREANIPLKSIASDLEVANILEGSVQKVGDNVRIIVQLIDANNDEHLWAAHYDRNISDIFKVQSEIARTIADNLEIILTAEEREFIENAPTTNLIAYDLYLKALHIKKEQDVSGRTKEDVESMIKMLKEVISMDDKFASAYGLLGEQYNKLNRWGMPKSIWVDSAMTMLDKSIELDPSDPDVYRYKAHIYELLQSEDKVKENLVEGLQHNPDDFLLLKNLGLYYERLGQQERAMDYFLKSWAVNKPVEDENFYDQFRKIFMNYDYQLVMKYYKKGLDLNPELSFIPFWLSILSIGEEKYKDALQYALQVEKLDITWNNSDWIAYCYLLNKQYDRAEEYFHKFQLTEKRIVPRKNWHEPYYAYVLIKQGKTEEGQQMMESFFNNALPPSNNYDLNSEFDHVNCVDLARKSAWENENGEAISWLKKSVVNAGEEYAYLWKFSLSDPLFENLWEEDGYLEVVTSIRKTEEYRRELLEKKLSEYHARNEMKWLQVD